VVLGESHKNLACENVTVLPPIRGSSLQYTNSKGVRAPKIAEIGKRCDSPILWVGTIPVIT